MEYVADTMVLIRHFSRSGALGTKAQEVLKGTNRGENIIWVSIISLAEIMYLAEKNRIPLTLDMMREVLENVDNYGIVDLDIEIVMVADTISGLELHDRLIVATAKHLEVPMITSDHQITDSGVVDIVWD